MRLVIPTLLLVSSVKWANSLFVPFKESLEAYFIFLILFKFHAFNSVISISTKGLKIILKYILKHTRKRCWLTMFNI